MENFLGNAPSSEDAADLALKRLSTLVQNEKLSLKAAYFELSASEKSTLQEKIGSADWEKLLAISGEKTPEMFFWSLLSWGRDMKFGGQEAKAQSIFGRLQQESVPEEIRKKASLESEAMVGCGRGEYRFEYLWSRGVQDATAYQTIAPMLVGTVFYQTFRAAALGRLAMTPGARWLTRGIGAKFAASFAGTALETPIFALGARALHQIAGDPVQENVWNDLASAGITLSALKFSGCLGTMASLPNLSTFFGLFGAHHLHVATGLQAASDRATTVTDILASIVSLGVGGNLGSRFLGTKFAAFQREMELRVSQPNSKSPTWMEPRPDLNAAIVSGTEIAVPRTAEKFSPQNPLLASRWLAVDSGGLGGGPSGETPQPSPEKKPPPLPRIPQFQAKLEVDPQLTAKLEALPGNIVQFHAKDEPNQVAFAMNHLHWWVGLIQRDVGEVGAQALVDGGKILFGRWQESPRRQRETEAMLKSLAGEASAQGWWAIHWNPPTVEAWWRPFWERLVRAKGTATSGSLRLDARLIAVLLKLIERENPETAQKWLQELAARDVDTSVEVHELMENDALDVSGTADDFFRAGPTALFPQSVTPRDVNAKLKEYYLKALAAADPHAAYFNLLELKKVLSLHRMVEAVRPPADWDGQVLAASPTANHPDILNFITSGPFPLFAHEFLSNEQQMSEAQRFLGYATLAYVYRKLGDAQKAEIYKTQAERISAGIPFQAVVPEEIFAQRQEATKLLQENWTPDRNRFPFIHIHELENLYRQGLIHAENYYDQIIQDFYSQAVAVAHLANLVSEKAMRGGGAAGLPPGAVVLHPGVTCRVGRSPTENDAVVLNNLVSKEHARIRVKDNGEMTIEDLGSRNGTFIQGIGAVPIQRITPGSEVPIPTLCTIRFGGVDVKVSLAGTGIPALYQDPQENNAWVLKKYHSPVPLPAPSPVLAGEPIGPGLSLPSLQEFLRKIGRDIQEIEVKAQEAKDANPNSQDTYYHILTVAWAGYVHHLLGKKQLPQKYLKLTEDLIRGVNSKLGMDASASSVEQVKEWLRDSVEDIKHRPFADLPEKNRQEIETWLSSDLHTALQKFQTFWGHPVVRMEALAYFLSLLHQKVGSEKLLRAVPPEAIDHFARLPKRDINSIPLEYRDLIPHPKDIVLDEEFQIVLNEYASAISAPDRIAVRYFGPAGTGKTTIPEMAAERMGVPLLRIPFSKRTDPSDLEGFWEKVEIDGQMVPVFKEGAPTVAMEYGFHLVFDEPDLARPGVLAFLNNVSAPGEYAWVRKKSGQLVQIHVHPGYRAIATENGILEIGREEHGKDFIRRFVPYYSGPWSKEKITKILAEVYENQGGRRRWDRRTSETMAIFHKQMEQLARGLVDPARNLAMPPLGTGVGQQVQFTPRSILRLAHRLVAQGPLTPGTLSRAIRAEYILPLADPNDQDQVWTQAQANFKDVAQRLGWQAGSIGPHAIPDPTAASISRKYLGGRPLPNGKFVWTDQALRVADEILWNESLGIDVMLLGDAGEGKTELPPQIAKLLSIAKQVHVPYYQKVVSSETDEEDLIGGVGRGENNKIEFIPGIVTLGVDPQGSGGVIHLDEYLLSDTGKLEAVMNPLMDSTRALILKNPYRLLHRHPNAFFLLSSNPPFGDFADRHEHSAAAMSRVAVIYLSGKFAMQSEDRQKIMAQWFQRPLGGVLAPAQEMVGVQFIAPSAGTGGAHRAAIQPRNGSPLSFSPFLRHSSPNQAQKVNREVRPLEIHPEVRDMAKKKWGIDLPVRIELGESDEGGGKVPQTFEVQEDGSKIPFDPEKRSKDFLKFTKYLTYRTQIEMVPVTQKVFKILYSFMGNHTTDLKSKQIILNLVNLLGMRVAGALGAGKHEWAHAVIDRPSPKYDYLGFEAGRLYANVVGDPRMNNYASSLRPDFAEQIEALYETMWKEEYTEEEIEKFQQALPHEQFADNIIYYWKYKKIMPWLNDQRVVAALEKALPILEPAFTLFPKTTDDVDVEEAAKKFYEILDKAYPYYKELFTEADKELDARIERGEPPELLRQPPMILIMRIPFLPPSPFPSTGEEKADSSDKAPALEPPPGPQMKGTMLGIGPQPPKDEAVSGAEGKNQDGESSQVPAEPPKPYAEMTPEEKAKLRKDILDARAEALADRFEPQDPEAFQQRKETIARAQGKLPQLDEEPSDPEAGEPEPASEPQEPQDPAADKPLSEAEIREIEARAQKVVREQVQGDLFLRHVPMSAIQAAQRLKRLIPPSNPTHMEGWFTQGKKYDKERDFKDEMSPNPTDKAMLRRLGIDEVDAQIIKVTDVTGSMHFAKENVLRGSAAATYLSETLKIRYGEILFGGVAKVAKHLGRPLSSYAKKNELLNIIDQGFSDRTLGGGTNIRDALDLAIQTLKKKKARYSYILLITDGGENVFTNPKTLEQLQEEAERADIHLMVLAMGQAQYTVPGTFKHYKFVSPDGADIPEMTIELFQEAHQKRLVEGGGR